VNTYETTFILEPGLDDTKVDSEIGRVSQWIQDGQGQVVDVQRWGKRRLAYEINRKRDGIYTLILHTSPSEVVHDIERRLRLNESVMRVLTVLHVPASIIAAAETPADDDAPTGGRRADYDSDDDE
jgi:small subunit ribosomal protein S6